MTLAYTDQPHIEFILKRLGLQACLAQLDYTNPPEPSDVAYAINRASTKIDFYLVPRYDPTTVLQRNDFVTWAATIIACVQIVRRDNAVQSGLQKDYDETIADLKDIQAGRPGCELPLGSPRSELGAWHSNLRIDQRFSTYKIRASQATSSNDQNSYFPRRYDPLDLWIEI
jgi:phage gp36-like protein